MVARRDSNSIGLTSSSSQPVAMACSRSLSSAYADHANDRNVAGLWIVLEDPHGFPPVTDRHFEVHQNYAWVLGQCQLAVLLAVLSRQNLEIANPLKAHLERVEVIVIVFDAEHFGHSASFIPAPCHSSARHSRRFAERNLWNIGVRSASFRPDVGLANNAAIVVVLFIR